MVDDLLQDVFLSFLSARFEHRSEASTAAFLRKVARHLLFKAKQRERSQPLILEALGAEEAWVEFDAEDGGSRYLTTLRECLAALKGKAAETLALRYQANLGQAEIANRLGLSLSGVKSILVRSRRRLRECVERRLAV